MSAELSDSAGPVQVGSDDVMSIVLTGPMGAGKSTVGRQVAKRLSLQFVDLDEAIEEWTGRSPGRIFDEDGEAEFRRLEAQMAAELLDGDVALVLALGGGAFMTAAVRALCAGDHVLSVYLHATVQESLIRVLGADGPRRPLLEVDDPSVRLTALLRERDPVYRQADLMVRTSDRTPDEIAREVVDRYRQQLHC